MKDSLTDHSSGTTLQQELFMSIPSLHWDGQAKQKEVVNHKESEREAREDRQQCWELTRQKER